MTQVLRTAKLDPALRRDDELPITPSVTLVALQLGDHPPRFVPAMP